MKSKTTYPLKPSERIAYLLEVQKEVGRDWLPPSEDAYEQAKIDITIDKLKFEMFGDWLDLKAGQI